MIVTMTSAEWHDAPGIATAGENGLNDYSVAESGAPSRAQTVALINSLGARVIGLAGAGATTGDPKARAAALALDTGAVVGASDFEVTAGCATGQCCTGVAGAGEAPNASGLCPLSLSFASNGTGVGSAALGGIVALTNSVRLDLHPVATDLAPNAVSTFIDHLELVTDGTDGLGCLTAASSSLADDFSGPAGQAASDGVMDTVNGVKPGTPLCIAVVSKAIGVAQTNVAQFFEVSLATTDTNVAVGRPRTIAFMIPPSG
jgi:hypothetical protein